MLDLVVLESDNWREEATDAPSRVWRNDAGDGLGLFYFDLPPDIPAALTAIEELRQFYRSMATEAGGALIELDVVPFDGLPGIRQIVKFPQSGGGMTYLGSCTIPRCSFSYVLKIQCEERGSTGLRDAFVLDHAIAQGDVSIGKDGVLVGWAADPYDPDFRAPVLRNQSDDERHDADFPNHPLSRLRRGLKDIESTLSIAAPVKKVAEFQPVPERQAKEESGGSGNAGPTAVLDQSLLQMAVVRLTFA